MSAEPDVASYLGIIVPTQLHNDPAPIVKGLRSFKSLIADARQCEDSDEMKDIISDMDWYESAIGDAIGLIEDSLEQAIVSLDNAMGILETRLTEEEAAELEQERIMYRLKNTKS